MAQRIILWTVTDPRGLSITLTDDVWHDIIGKHQEMQDQHDAVKIAAASPDEIYFDPETTSKRDGAKIYMYYKRIRVAPKTKFIVVVVKIVVENESDQGYVQSAWSPYRIQKRLVREWKK